MKQIVAGSATANSGSFFDAGGAGGRRVESVVMDAMDQSIALWEVLKGV